ncbi:carbonic anhydrase 1-like [Anoplophora glabripennis]|uniref:carbonic anhydrase 1-like n=1 Tax=Anoplophora glabripennis TaxID=217634 RepID=UPI00087508E5|nr:carbonic anhydrase 1-like [Anoplophora glabripennis]
MLVKILVALICFIYFPGYCQDFGYDGNIGPNHWSEKYSKCVGKHQSPIDIEEDNVKIIKFPPLKFDHFNSNLKEVKILNNGHTVVLSISKGKLPVINGGPLRENYKFTQLHFHWGVNDTEGSESLINNHR